MKTLFVLKQKRIAICLAWRTSGRAPRRQYRQRMAIDTIKNEFEKWNGKGKERFCRKSH